MPKRCVKGFYILNRGIRHLGSRARDFGQSRDGAVAILFAVAILPMFGLTSLAIDYAGAHSAKTKLQSAADATALDAAKRAQAYDEKNNISADYKIDGKAHRGLVSMGDLFSQVSGSGDRVKGLSYTIEIEKKGNEYVAKIIYSGQYKMIAPLLSSASHMDVAGQSVSKIALQFVENSAFLSIDVMMDASGSMGIGASPADMNRLHAVNGCAFVCHGYGAPYGSAPAGVKIRTDVVREAVGNLITKAADAKDLRGDKPVSMALHAFEGSITTLQPMTTDFNAIRNALPRYHSLMTHTGSSIGYNIEMMAKAAGISGEGATKVAPRKFLFVITDGLEDRSHGGMGTMTGPLSYSGYVGAVDPKHCARAKKDGVTIAVLYTVYYNIPTTNWDYFYKASQGNIEPRLRECASKDFFFVATDGASIKQQLEKMFKSAVTVTAQKVRLAQ